MSASSCSAGRSCAGKPVVVAGSGPRAVVTTASYEARRFGIFSATPAARARRRCPDAVFIPPDFEAYRARSREVMAVLRAHVERVEVVGPRRGLPRPDRPRPARRAAARRVKAAVRQRTGLGCSIGIGPNKLVAKVASDAEKPDGFVVLSRERRRERFADASPGLCPGIGPKTAERLEELGHRHARARSRRRPTSSSPSGSAPGSARTWPRSRASRTTARSRRCAWPSPSRARRPSTATCAACGQLEPVLERLTERALRHARAPGAARAHDRHQGAPRRLLDASRAPARCPSAGQRRRPVVAAWRRELLARARPAAPGAAARRARGGPRRVVCPRGPARAGRLDG